jgi:hypothetical protein
MFNSMKKVLAGIAALAALALGGAALAGAASSGTSTSTSTPSTAGTPGTSSSRPAPPASGMPAPGTAAHENAETPVTGEKAAKAQAAAVKAVGGGTAGAVTTDHTKDGYETTVTKSDGSKVEVHLDSSFNAMTGPLRAGGNGSPTGPPPGAPGA